MKKILLSAILLLIFLSIDGIYGQPPATQEELSDNDKALQEAVANLDFEQMGQLLRLGANLRKVDKYSLQYAIGPIAESGDYELFRAFVDSDRVITRDRNRLLMSAVNGGNPDIVRILLSMFGIPDSRHDRPENIHVLVRAAENDNLEVFNILIQRGLEVNVKDNRTDKYPLMAAAENGNTEMMQALIDRGANIHAYDTNTHNALYYACRGGHLKAVELLLDNGARFSPDSYPHPNAIIPAAEHGHTEVVKRLIEAGCDLEVGTYDDKTPLILAAMNGHYEMAKYLLEQGARTTIRGYIHPFSIAAGRGHLDLVELFIDHFEDDPERDVHISKALASASAHGQIGIMLRLLETGARAGDPQDYLQEAVMAGQAGSVAFWIDRGADPNAFYKDSSRYPQNKYLDIAANYGHTDVVKTLVERGACIEPMTLAIASAWGDPEMIEFLLANGAEAGSGNLLFAARRLKADNVQTLLSHGLQVDFRDRFGRTALIATTMYYFNEMDENQPFYVVAENVYTISKILIENGADVNAKDYEGMTPLMFAVYGGYTETVRLLLASGARLRSTNKFGDRASDFFHPYYPEVERDTVLLELLRIKYSQADIDNEFDAWPKYKRKSQYEKDCELRQAVREGSHEEIKRAIDAGADVNDYGEDSGTPLYIALELGYHPVSILRLLVENGAWIEESNCNGTTSLMRAVMAGDYDTVEYFIEQGADINRKNDYENAAMIFAAKNGDVRMIKLLLAHGADMNTRGNCCTPLSIARDKGMLEAAEYLESLGAEPYYAE